MGLSIKGIIKSLSHLLPDKLYLSLMYRRKVGKRINWNAPQTFNEKLQWLKLYYHNPDHIKMVDKASVKEYIAQKIGSQYVIKTIGGPWEHFSEIDFEKLPKQFVLKCTHDSGGIVICKDKDELDIEQARKKIEKALRRKFVYYGREWPYGGVKPQIIAEEFLVDESGYELKDYKIFCFWGKAKLLYVASDRSVPNEPCKFDFYDMNFQHLDIRNGHPNSSRTLKAPASLPLMIEFAERLSQNEPHMRVDFYDVNGHPYFGEITFYHMCGFEPFDPPEWDEKIGNWLELPKRNQEKN